ncbi:MAG: YbhB/YbcL family Raf kinase inhibitor-like protein [Deltaproteobacteria bacterium]|nr:MAG: YbhB/YbcL family Raf kinase inhibitor-like protein [Deltaproteobacteria bacterium]
MRIWSESFEDGEAIPARFAFGVYDPEAHVRLSENENPHLAWADLPEGTRSLVLLVHDSDVPSKPDDVNQEGRTVPADLPRVDFYHWVLVDLPPEPSRIEAGAFSKGVTARGKDAGASPRGRHGLNDYTGWFAGDAEMEGQYFGYDGPCPPWNDSLVHHYHFTLHALDLERLPVEGAFTGPDVKAAMEGHVLATASLTGTYHINPEARG